MYYFLALIYIGATSASLLIKRRVVREDQTRFAEYKAWDVRSHSSSRIDHVAADIRGSSGDALVSGHIGDRWTRVQELRRDCDKQIDGAKAELAAAAGTPEAAQLQKDLDVFHAAVEAMAQETDRLFNYLVEENPAKARAHLSVVDQKYQIVARAFSHLRVHLDEIQQAHLQARLAAASTLEKVECAIAILIATLVVGVSYFWLRLASRIRFDVSEKEDLLSKVRDAENKYRAIFDNVIEGIFQMTPDGRFVTANRALAAMYGYDSPQQLMSELADVGSQLYVDHLRRAELFRILEKEDFVSGFEVEVFRRDGRTIWVSQNVRTVRDAAGGLRYFEGTVENITSRWWAERRRGLLYMTTKVLAESASLAEARPKILQAICEILEWDMGAVWDIDSNVRLLRCVEVWHRPNIDIDEFEAATSRMTVAPGIGLAGRVWVSGEPDWLADISGESAVLNAGIAAKNGMRSAFGVPVKIGQQVVHVLEFFSPNVPQPDPELLQMLAAIGLQLGQLIERKRDLDALRENEARKAAILESALDCIITFDEDGIISEFNPAAERAFGYPRSFALGKDLVSLVVPPAHRESFRRDLVSLDSGSFTPSMGRRAELLVIRADRGEFPVEMATSRIELYGRAMFTAYIRDITERRRAERARSELAAVVESSSDAIVGKTLDGIIVSWNSGAERLYGYSAAEAIGRHVYILVPPDRLDELPQTLVAVRRGESITNFETVRLRKDGRRIAVSLTESPIRNERGHITGISSIARDMTDRKKLEEQLLQSQKMEAVGRLAGGIAHDFNNILTAILGYSDMLLRQCKPEDPHVRGLAEIKKAGEFAASLTHQLLAFSRRQSQQLRVVSVNQTVNHIHKMLRRLIVEDVSIMVVADSAIGSIKADPSQLEQIIMNLAVNARDAMPLGGVLTIHTANVTVDITDRFEMKSVPPGDYVCLTISDTGCGMTDEVKQRLFEPFFTTKEKGKGTGLGLATCYGIIKQSGGHVLVESAPGQGTSFHVYFPRVEAEPRARAAGRGLDSGRLPRGTETILLVEDEGSVRTLTAQILRKLGYNVFEAEDAEVARSLIEGMDGSRLDLLLADVVLPNCGGKQLADWIEERHEETKVLFISGYVEEAVFKQQGLQPGSAFLQKPFSPADLACKIREVFETA